MFGSEAFYNMLILALFYDEMYIIQSGPQVKKKNSFGDGCHFLSSILGLFDSWLRSYIKISVYYKTYQPLPNLRNVSGMQLLQ